MKSMLERLRIAIDEHSSLSSIIRLRRRGGGGMEVVLAIEVREPEMIRVARKLVLSREHSIEHRAALAPQSLLRRSERAISDIDREHSTRQHRSNGLVGSTRVSMWRRRGARAREEVGGGHRGVVVALALGGLVDQCCSHRSHPHTSSSISVHTSMMHARRRQMMLERARGTSPRASSVLVGA